MISEGKNIWSKANGMSTDDILDTCREVHERREELDREFRQWLEDQGFDEHEEKHLYVVARGPHVLVRAETPERLLTEISALDSIDGVEMFQADTEFFGFLRDSLEEVAQ